MIRKFSRGQQICLRYGLQNSSTQMSKFSTPATPVKREKLVVLGTGWAGHQLMSKIDPEKYELHVVSPRNHMLFTPLLASASVGTLEIRSICHPIRPLVTQKEGYFYQSACYEIDVDKQTVRCSTSPAPFLSAMRHLTPDEHEFTIAYDKLVIACGMQVNDFGIEGVRKYACYMKETHDAREVRRALMTRLEEACHPGLDTDVIRQKLTFVVVGGGPTGVEFAAELSDFLEKDVRKQYPEIYAHASVILVEGNELLSSFGKKLRDFTLKKMRRRKVDVRLKKFVRRVDEKNIFLNDGTKIQYGLLVWGAGVKSYPFISDLEFEHNMMDQILTDEYCRVLNYKNVFAIGDCADIKDQSLPPTAAVANSQALFLSNFLNAGCDTNTIKAYKFQKILSQAYIGQGEAVQEWGDGVKVPLSGYAAAFLWHTAYWTMQGSVRNIIMVPFDWFKSFWFGRDLTRF